MSESGAKECRAHWFYRIEDTNLMRSKVGRKMVPRPNELFFCSETDENDLEAIECKCMIIALCNDYFEQDRKVRPGSKVRSANDKVDVVLSDTRRAAEIKQVDEMIAQLGEKHIGYGDPVSTMRPGNKALSTKKGEGFRISLPMRLGYPLNSSAAILAPQHAKSRKRFNEAQASILLPSEG